VRRQVACALLIATGALAACGDDDDEAAASKVPRGCEKAASGTPQELPAELPRPAVDPIALQSRSGGEQSIVEGFVARTPSQAIADIEHRPGLKVLFREDEGNDAELTVTDGRTRTAYKLVKACSAGSRFTAVMVPEPR